MSIEPFLQKHGNRDDETRKGVTLAEIMEATGWQKHTVCGFVSILGS
jgi:hypothetical protein